MYTAIYTSSGRPCTLTGALNTQRTPNLLAPAQIRVFQRDLHRQHSNTARMAGTAAVRTKASTAEAEPISEIAEKTVTVFTTVGCGFCRKVKAALADAGIDFQEVFSIIVLRYSWKA